MSVRTIVYYPDKRLREISKEIVNIDLNIKSLANDLIETMIAHSAAGLSAVQIGVPLRIAAIHARVIQHDDAINLAHYSSLVEASPLVLVNPTQVLLTGVKYSEQEGCVSFPGINIWVDRPSSLLFEATSLDGKINRYTANGIVAQCLLHEIEHMDGKLLIDNVGPLKREAIKKKMKKYKLNQ